MINFRVGILGAGHIAEKIADTLNKLDAFEPYAIASRDINKANEFGDKFNIEKRYGSYEELVNDPDVELIYIATPHSHHAEQAKMCINAGKPVLVEKAFSYNFATAAEVYKLSEEKGVFCSEAMWIRYLPMYHQIAKTIGENKIGRVTNITCSLGYFLIEKERIVLPELAGGVLLDLGIYPINLMCMFFMRNPDSITSTCLKHKSGVDIQETIQFNYAGGQNGTAFVTGMFEADNTARIYGTTGYLEIDNMNNPTEVRVYSHKKQLIERFTPPEAQISGYEFEFIAARDAIILGKTETAQIPHADSLNMMRVMDTLRQVWGVRFPMEPENPNPPKNVQKLA